MRRRAIIPNDPIDLCLTTGDTDGWSRNFFQ